MDEYKYLFKVVLVGNAGVGKTCLVRRFTQGLFPPGQGATIGVDFMIKSVDVDGERVKLQIWDTAGQERFRSITQSYYKSANALRLEHTVASICSMAVQWFYQILVYDLTCQPSFDALPQWLEEIKAYASVQVLSYLVGNKMDQINHREIPVQVGADFARRNDMHFMETSAKEADNVDALFMDVARQLTFLAKKNNDKPRERGVSVSSPGGGGASCCS